MKYRLLFILLSAILLPGVKVMAQEDYAPGFIINSSGDTIQGFIDQQDYMASFRECNFKSSPDAGPVKYMPKDIRGYHFNKGKMFVSKKVEFHGDSTDLFLECLLDGIADIYLLKENGAPQYFIEKQGEGLHELIREEKDEYRTVDNTMGYPGEKHVRMVKNKYLGILHSTFSDDRQLYDKIDQTPLTAKGLIRISKSYHNDVCTDYNCIDYTRNMGSKFSYGIKTGINQSWAGIKDAEGSTTDTRMIYGLQMIFHPPLISKNLGFGLGIMGSRFHIKNIYTGDVLEHWGGWDGMNVETSYQILQIPVSLQYTFPFSKIQPVAEFGYNNEFHLNTISSVNKVTRFGDVPAILSSPSFYSFGLFAGAGAKIRCNDKLHLNLMVDYQYMIQSTFVLNASKYTDENQGLPILDLIYRKSVILTAGLEIDLDKKQVQK